MKVLITEDQRTINHVPTNFTLVALLHGCKQVACTFEIASPSESSQKTASNRAMVLSGDLYFILKAFWLSKFHLCRYKL